MKANKGEYVTIPKTLFKVDLSIRAKYILMYCLIFSKELEDTPQSIAKAIGTTSDSVLNAIYELEEKGYCIITDGEYTFTEIPNVYSNVSIKETKEKVKIPKRKKFVPPTLEEVKAYIKENGYSIDGEYFFKYYASNDWHAKNGKPVLNWKQTIISWEGRNKKQVSQSNVQEPPKYRDLTNEYTEEDWY